MTPSKPLVLVIEDEPQMQRFLGTLLEAHDFRRLEAFTAAEGLAHAASYSPDLILLDLGLPDLDGLAVTEKLREWCSIPIIVLSARGQEEDKVKALAAGADDYLTKPFGAGELLARMRAAVRHASRSGTEPEEPEFRVGDLRVDRAARRVYSGDAEVHLSPNEYKLLTTLVRHAGKVLTHRQLLKEVWGPNAVDQTHYLRVYMAQLRHKLEADPARPRYLITEPGVGYRLRVEDVPG